MRKFRVAGLPFLFWLSSGTAQLPSESQNQYDTVVDGRFFFHLHSLGFANIMARVNFETDILQGPRGCRELRTAG